MKKSIGVILLIFIVSAVSMTVMASSPPPPPGDPTAGGGTWIGGAPIANGLFILIALGLSYGARKLYNSRKRRISE